MSYSTQMRCYAASGVLHEPEVKMSIWMYIEGKGYRHRDRDFRELLQKVQAPRFCKPVVLAKTGKKYYYECTSCHYIYVRKKRWIRIDMYVDAVEEN